MVKAITWCLATSSIFQIVSAHPYGRYAHQLDHVKRDVVATAKTHVEQATAQPQVTVVVDQFGKPVKTVSRGLPSSVYNPPVAAFATQPAPDSALVVPSSSSTPVTTPSPPAAVPGSSSSGYGLAYSPYNRDGTCKIAEQVLSDFALFGEYGLIRTYGTDCDTIRTVYAACKATGKQLFAGIFSLNGLPDQVATIAAGVNGDWSKIHTISVGNEVVDQGQASAADVMAAVATARELLRAAGYQGPVVTVDTLAATTAPGNVVLCDKSDYCAVNAHPFFDSTATAAGAGKWLTDRIDILRSKLANPSQKIVISETGWPSQASPNGAAVASPDLQKTAISAIKSAFSSDPSGVIFLSAFNRQWLKGNTGQFGQEYWFGLMGDCPSG